MGQEGGFELLSPGWSPGAFPKLKPGRRRVPREGPTNCPALPGLLAHLRCQARPRFRSGDVTAGRRSRHKSSFTQNSQQEKTAGTAGALVPRPPKVGIVSELTSAVGSNHCRVFAAIV